MIEGSISRLSRKCRECPYVKTCKEKRMEMFAFKCEDPHAVRVTMDVTQPSMAPVLRDTSERAEIREQITEYVRKEINKQLYCNYKGRS